jgi:vacuolar-type H+-ATPase catalytic subunit A/Vma1
MDTKVENYAEKWEALREAYDAKARRLGAGKKVDYDKIFDDFGGQVAAMSDWTEASWDEFTARVDTKWQEMAIDRQD